MVLGHKKDRRDKAMALIRQGKSQFLDIARGIEIEPMDDLRFEYMKHLPRKAWIEACKDDCKGKQMQRGIQQQQYLARSKEQH